MALPTLRLINAKSFAWHSGQAYIWAFISRVMLIVVSLVFKFQSLHPRSLFNSYSLSYLLHSYAVGELNLTHILQRSHIYCIFLTFMIVLSCATKSRFRIIALGTTGHYAFSYASGVTD